MHLTISDIISWILIGAAAGLLTGFLVRRKKEGSWRFAQLGIGLAGAFLGMAVVRLLKIDFGIGRVQLRWEDLVASVVGALLVIGGLRYARYRARRGSP